MRRKRKRIRPDHGCLALMVAVLLLLILAATVVRVFNGLG